MKTSSGREGQGAIPDFVASLSGSLFVLSAKGFLGHSTEAEIWDGLRRTLLSSLLSGGGLLLVTAGDEASKSWSDICEWHVEISALRIRVEAVGAGKPEAINYVLQDGDFDTDSQVLLRGSTDDLEALRATVIAQTWDNAEAICSAFPDVVHMFDDGQVLVWRRGGGFEETELRSRVLDWCAPRQLTLEWRREAAQFEENWVFRKRQAWC